MQLKIKNIQKNMGDFVRIEVEDLDQQTNVAPLIDVTALEQPVNNFIPEYKTYYYDINPLKESTATPGTFIKKTVTDIKKEIKDIIGTQIVSEAACKTKQEAFFKTMSGYIGSVL